MIVLGTYFWYKYNFAKLLKKYCMKQNENNHLKEIFERKVRNSGFDNYVELQW